MTANSLSDFSPMFGRQKFKDKYNIKLNKDGSIKKIEHKLPFTVSLGRKPDLRGNVAQKDNDKEIEPEKKEIQQQSQDKSWMLCCLLNLF